MPSKECHIGGKANKECSKNISGLVTHNMDDEIQECQEEQRKSRRNLQIRNPFASKGIMSFWINVYNYSICFYISDCIRRSRWKSSIPDGYPNRPKAFKNIKGLVALVVAFYAALMNEESDEKSFQTIWEVSSPKASIANRAGRFLDEKLILFEKQVPEKGVGKTIEELFPIFEDSWNIQLHCFHKKTHNFLLSIPEAYLPNRRQLYFLGTYDDFCNFVALEVVQNIITYFNVYGFFCFVCKRRTTGVGSHHKCQKQRNCFSCRRPFLTNNTYVTKKTAKLFCDSAFTHNSKTKEMFLHTDGGSFSESCEKCNMIITTEHCKKFHLSKVCMWGWSCPKCKKYTWRGKNQSSINAIKENHVCDIRLCYICSEPKTKTHLCRLLGPGFPKEFPNLAFLQLMYSGSTKSHCQDCFYMNEEEKCTFCSKNAENEEPNVCVALIEQKARENFEEQVFVNDSIPYSASQHNNILHYEYLPDTLKDLSMAPKGVKTRFNKRKKIFVEKERVDAEKGCPIKKLLGYILEKNLSNTVFLVNCQESCDLDHIFRAAWRAGLMPNVVHCQNKIGLLNIQELGIRFVDTSNFLDESIEELAEKSNNCLDFFPQKWNNPAMYLYIGKPPSSEDFFYADDDSKTVAKKKQYARDLEVAGNWHFADRLIKHCKHKTHVTAKTTTDFLRQAFLCQDLMRMQLKVAPKTCDEIPYLHPFFPTFTKASYAYNMFLLFTDASKKIRTVREPISINSSKGEMEFCSYMRFKHPKEDLIDSWSENGQMHFREASPDLYVQRTHETFFYNGCYWHSHADPKCPVMKNKTHGRAGEKMEAKKKFKEKMEKLKNNNKEVLSTTTVWECSWRRQRETPGVKNFLDNHYVPYPSYRLHSRASVRGGPNEVFFGRWRDIDFPNEILYAMDKVKK